MKSNETLCIIKQRRSIRSFKSQQITDDELQAVLEVGQYAPHASEEAWYFTVVQNQDLLQRLNLAAKEAARSLDSEWLRSLGNDERFHCLYNAPTPIIVSGKEKSTIPPEADCAAATENMLLAAESIGIWSCWIFFVTLALNSSNGVELRKELRLPAEYKPFAGVVLGYKAGPTPEVAKRKSNLVTIIK